MQQIQINVISFKQVVDNLSLAFYGEMKMGFAHVYWGKLYEFIVLQIQVYIKPPKEELEQVVEVKWELIDQVYQFSRMYWKSTNQQSLQVTIK